MRISLRNTICAAVFVGISFTSAANSQDTLVGMQLADAQKILAEKNVRSVVKRTRGCHDGLVVGVAPPEPWSTNPSQATLVVEDGKASIATPDVSNWFWEEAGRRVSELGLNPVFERVKSYTDNCDADFGVSTRTHAQSPGAGTPLCKGATVTMYVYEVIGRKPAKLCNDTKLQ